MSGNITVTVLGSGTSHGVPMIGCKCPVCLSTDPRDNRTRCSICVQTPLASILVDSPPDLRVQALRENIQRVDCVLFTHAHADHIMGFDDLRRFCDILGSEMPIYGSSFTIESIRTIFPYAFRPSPYIAGYVRILEHIVDSKPFDFGGLHITPLPVPHGAVINTAYLFSRKGKNLLAYMTDCNKIPDPVFELLNGLDTLIIDGTREKSHTSHFNVEGAIAASKIIKPQKTYLTHQAHDKSHAQRSAELPPNIEVAYDGLKIVLPWE